MQAGICRQAYAGWQWLRSAAQYPGIFNASSGFWETSYSEGLLLGYRWFDAAQVEPAFPFGHGLSYSSFSYSALAISGQVGPASNASISLSVSNSAGSPAGSETVQLYVAGALPGDPVRTLKGFASTGLLQPGASTQLSFSLSAAELRFWSEGLSSWQPFPPGSYDFWLGSSSRDLRESGSVQVLA